MLLSMTGFGRATASFEEKDISVEVRSLNSKFTDIRIKIPQNYRDKESDLRKILGDNIKRGKIELNLDITSPDGDESFALNGTLLKKYYRELSTIAEELNMPKSDLLPAILRLADVVAPSGKEFKEEEWNAILQVLHQALDNFTNFRKTEGKVLETDLKLRINNIQKYLTAIPPFEEERVVKLRAKLLKNLEENFSKDRVDQNRYEQEVIYYLEKIDITEEKVRLGQHCKYFLEQLEEKATSKGRKLSFISQEIGREINTLGAKAYSSDIQKLVVKMKDDLEKVKEQIANSV